MQYFLYHVLLREPLRAHDLETAGPAVTRWLKVVVLWQALVLGASAAYVATLGSHHAHGVAWVAPAVGAVLGSAIPLQLAVSAILRSGRGA